MQPVCVSCGREMTCVRNGQTVYHPFEHARPDEEAQEVIGNLVTVNTDVLFEGTWKDGDIDFIVSGDKYQCPSCGIEIVVGFGETSDARYTQEVLKHIIERAVCPIKILRG